MKKITYTIGFAFAMLATSNAIVQQGFGTNKPDKSSAVEIKSNNKGLLIPRINIEALNSSAPIMVAQGDMPKSLLVYNTNTTIGEGFYYWNGSKWEPFTTGSTDLNTKNASLKVVGTELVLTDSDGGEVKVLLTDIDKQQIQTFEIGTDHKLTIALENGGTKNVDLKPTIQAGQIKYEVLEGTAVSVTTDATNADNIKYTVNADIATKDDLGVVKIGEGLTVETDGTINVDFPQMTVDTNTTTTVSKDQDYVTIAQTESGVAPYKTIDYKIGVNVANGTNLGVVKQAAEDPTVNINATGELSVDLTNTELTGDVTGPLNATKVVKIQNVPVNATPPTEGQVLKEVSGTWTPSTLTTGDITAGKAITSNTLTVSTDGATAALKDVSIEIKPGTEGQVLTTTGAAGAETTTWVNRLVTGTDVVVAANSGYSFYVPEIVINVTLANADQTMVFPDASKAKGQTISIKIANTTDTHTGYLNLLDTYGSMPYQGWIVKSNGTDWVIVGRN